MRTVDGKIVVIPNGKIIAGNIINFSREPVRRNEFIIGVAYDSDIDQVKKSSPISFSRKIAFLKTVK
jgi:small conductance mechanosensitive channel